MTKNAADFLQRFFSPICQQTPAIVAGDAAEQG
jgi:hypothetical protein